MSKDLYKPTTRGMRAPLDNGSVNDTIVNPPRFVQLGGLKSPSKIGKRNAMTLKKPGATRG